MSLWNVMKDVGGLYMEAAFPILSGGSGMFLVVQSFYWIGALKYGAFIIWTDTDVNFIALTIVENFTAFSLTGRLIRGATVDQGYTPTERVMLAFKFLRNNVFLMAISMMVLTIPSKLAVIIAVIGIGMSYGACFCVSPSLSTHSVLSTHSHIP